MKIEKIYAEVIKDTNFNGTRLITLSCLYPKFIQAQINTHRSVVKNASSSRALPSVRFNEHLYLPEMVGINKSGMEATEYLTGETLKEFQDDWLSIYHVMLNEVRKLDKKYNPHKQLLNRLVEPFIMTKGIVTATLEAWQHVLSLRMASDAQPEFQLLAQAINDSINNSVSIDLREYDYHLPYIDDKIYNLNDDIDELERAIKISASCIAQVSYRKLDTTDTKALDIFTKLNIFSDHPHISPVQHICMSIEKTEDNVKEYQGYFAEMGQYIQVSKFVENQKTLL